ncbi:MAG: hypothetical protein ACI9CD_001303 [Candidatus Deianiraeaceae bacterium]|jgi:hypothetical protein
MNKSSSSENINVPMLEHTPLYKAKRIIKEFKKSDPSQPRNLNLSNMHLSQASFEEVVQIIKIQLLEHNYRIRTLDFSNNKITNTVDNVPPAETILLYGNVLNKKSK